MDFKEMEERMARMSEDELYKKLMFFPSGASSDSSIGEVVGSIPNILITDYVDEQPKKKPIPFYQTLHKHPKFVRK